MLKRLLAEKTLELELVQEYIKKPLSPTGESKSDNSVSQ